MQEILATGPDKARSWVDSRIDDPNLDHGFHWLALAESAARKGRAERDLKWASLAIHVYEHWASLVGTSAQESSRLSIMFLRAFLIKHLGSEVGDHVLDVRNLVAQFEEGLPYSVSEAAKLSVGWEQLEVAKIRELRRIKDRLAPFELLAPTLLEPFPRINEWLAIRNQLP